MICDQCKAEGTKSTVQVLYSSSTCMAGGEWYDEEGRYHYHDPNTHSTAYRCSNGHEFTVKSERNKCWCESGSHPPSLSFAAHQR